MCDNHVRLSLQLLLAIVFLMIIWPQQVAAQIDRGSISGTVTDPAGSVVQGARVELVAVATSLHRDAVTNAAGIYDFPALPVGSYNITITKEGFGIFQMVNVEPSVGQPRTMDVR